MIASLIVFFVLWTFRNKNTKENKLESFRFQEHVPKNWRFVIVDWIVVLVEKKVEKLKVCSPAAQTLAHFSDISFFISFFDVDDIVSNPDYFIVLPLVSIARQQKTYTTVQINKSQNSADKCYKKCEKLDLSRFCKRVWEIVVRLLLLML